MASVTAFYFECTHIWCLVLVCQHFEHKNKLCNEQKSDNLVFVFVYHVAAAALPFISSTHLAGVCGKMGAFRFEEQFHEQLSRSSL